MKQFALFGGNNYYPGGGWNDFKGFFDSIEEAKSYAFKKRIKQTDHLVISEEIVQRWDWFHIADTTTLAIVLDSEGSE